MAIFMLHDRTYTCPVELALSAVEGKWKTLMLWRLREGTLRYGELRRLLPKITHKMLGQGLRELEADGLVRRTVFPVIPPHVEYTLTDEGERFVPILRAMQGWGMAYKARPETPAG